MKYRPIILALFIFGVCLSAIGAERQESENEPAVEMKDWKTLPWHQDLPSALAEAAERGVPVFVDFSTSWCGWCRRLEQDTYSHPSVWGRLKDTFALAHLDGDKEKELVQQYGVRGYPNLLILDKDGQVLFRHAGYANPETFLARYIEPFAEYRGLGRALAKWEMEDDQIIIRYLPNDGPLSRAEAVYLHHGFENWQEDDLRHELMIRDPGGAWVFTVTLPDHARQINFVFADGPRETALSWDNNARQDWHVTLP